jgi:predicted dehydrogenase
VNLLGPVQAVAAVGRGRGSERLVATGPLAGTTVTAEVPTTVIGTLTFESGVIGSLFASFDTAGSRAPHFEIHGTAGSLSLGDPNRFDGEVRFRAIGSETWEDVPLRFPSDVERGIGLADMVDAIRSDRAHRATGELAYHVLDVLLALEEATTTGRTQTIASRVERPAPLEAGVTSSRRGS